MGKRLTEAVSQYFKRNLPVFRYKGQNRYLSWNEVDIEHGGEAKNPVIIHNDIIYWKWFFELHSARRYSGVIPQSISFADIQAWKDLTNKPVEPHHIDLLRDMDGAFMGAHTDVKRQRDDNDKRLQG